MSSPSEKRTVAPPPTSPQSLSLLTPRSNCTSRAAAAKAKSYPQKPVSTSRTTRTNPQSAKSAGYRLVDILTYGGGLTEEVDELPLPPSSAKSPRSMERGRQSQKGRQERKIQTTPTHDSRLNTSDVVDLLVVDDEEEEEEVGDLEQCEHDDLNSDNIAAATGKKRKGVREKEKQGTGNGHASETESKEKGGAERKRNEEKKATKSGGKAGRKEVSRGGRDRGKARSTRNGNGEGGENVPEDTVTSPQGVLHRGDILTTPSAGGGKWSLRARSAVRPPAYLATDLQIGRKLSRKRDRSPTRLLDILISEPDMKKMKCMAASRGEEAEDRDDRGVSEAVAKIPDNRARLTRTHTLPRTKEPSGAASARPAEPSVSSTTTTNHHHRVKPQKNKKGSVGGEPRKTAVSKKMGGGGAGKSSKERKVSSAKPLRKRKRLLGAIDWDSISEESEVSDSGSNEEYELGSEEPGSESEAEEEEEEEPIDPPASSRKNSIQSCSVANWSPELSPLPETTPVALPRTRGRSRKNHAQTISKTPSGRTPAGSTPGHPTLTTPAASSRKRVRPPKRCPQTISKIPSYSPPTQTTPARKRGRPPKSCPQTISKTPSDRASTPGCGATPGSKTAASKTPGGRTPAGHKTPASRSATGRTPRVVPTPNLPQKKKPAAGGAERTDFDKVRQRYSVLEHRQTL